MSNWQKLQGRLGGGGGKPKSAGPHGPSAANARAKPTASGVPPPFIAPEGTPALLEAGHPQFEDCVARSFRGFVKQSAPGALPTDLVTRVHRALEQLKDDEFFHHDVVTNINFNLCVNIHKHQLVNDTCANSVPDRTDTTLPEMVLVRHWFVGLKM